MKGAISSFHLFESVIIKLNLTISKYHGELGKIMTQGPNTGVCISCKKESATSHYHGSDSQKMELCKSCYDVYLAKEMLQYWKDHIEEEKRRVGK